MIKEVLNILILGKNYKDYMMKYEVIIILYKFVVYDR